MTKNSLYWGIGITVVWLTVIISFWIFGGLSSPDSLNELGDFLAGIFAPIAFLWLVLGYVQQGKQLEQNTKALEQQANALDLQIREMNANVRQQKLLIDLQEIQLRDMQKTIEPRFYISDPKVITVYSDPAMTRNSYVSLYLTFENLGEDAFNIKIQPSNKSIVQYKENKFLAGEVNKIVLELDQLQIDELNKNNEVKANFKIKYESKSGQVSSKLIYTFIYQTDHPFYKMQVYLADEN